jgi:amino acid adenylation domain-containing protein
MNLRDLVIYSAQKMPDALAIKGPDSDVSYSQLDGLANRFARALSELGVKHGDRVGIWLEKSTSAVAAMQAVLRLNAVYVPLDPLSPVARTRTIVRDCGMRALVTTQKRADAVLVEDLQHIACLCLDGSGVGLNWSDLHALSDKPMPGMETDRDEIAYILYTSGSTGKPKGVCISNRNALAFIEWAAEVLKATPADHFANHAPFHFDLSVLDLYVAFYVSAAVFLIPDGMSYVPGQLVNFILKEEITIWYSVPSALTLMEEQGGFLDQQFPSLRAILYAGEPFPVKHLRRLYQSLPGRRFLNLYGPTETNVCTFYEISHVPDNQTKLFPIGKACCGDHVWAQKEDGTIAQPGEEGELMVTGPTVMVGYWGRPEHGKRPYPTGDLVYLRDDGNYVYLGRRDHMVKVRGYRIEPGDIEATLAEHPAIHEAAVIVAGTGLHAQLVAFAVLNINRSEPPLLEIKRHCAERLPRYMVIDEICVVSALPRTRNGKIDRLALLSLAQEKK